MTDRHAHTYTIVGTHPSQGRATLEVRANRVEDAITSFRALLTKGDEYTILSASEVGA